MGCGDTGSAATRGGKRNRSPDARWPPRSQRLLREVRTLCNNWLHEPLRLVMVHFDMRLHEQLDRAMGMVEQQRNSVTRQRLLKERRSFEQHLLPASNARSINLASKPRRPRLKPPRR